MIAAEHQEAEAQRGLDTGQEPGRKLRAAAHHDIGRPARTIRTTAQLAAAERTRGPQRLTPNGLQGRAD